MTCGSKPKRLWITLADHFEPLGGRVSMETATKRVLSWQARWPTITEVAPKDAAGQPPRYTFFYPQEEYDRRLLQLIEPLVRAEIVDVEVHIHHDRDTACSLRNKLVEFCYRLHQQHNLLRVQNGRIVFGFIHGNWALDNSRHDGRWCGVTGETQLLHDLGCYADMTMPSFPSETQSRIINQIYWATGDPCHPRAFDRGIEVKAGEGVRNSLLMIPGPLGFRFKDRRLPRIETGELAIYDPPTPYRVDRWIDLAPRIGDDIFVKLHSHAAREDNAGALLGTPSSSGALASMFRWVHEIAQERGLELHWASAYQMYQAIDRLLLRSPTGEAEKAPDIEVAAS